LPNYDDRYASNKNIPIELRAMDSDGLMTEFDEFTEGTETEFIVMVWKTASHFWILPASKLPLVKKIEANLRAWSNNSDSVFSSDETLSIKKGYFIAKHHTKKIKHLHYLKIVRFSFLSR
jgi:hypothetical protein